MVSSFKNKKSELSQSENKEFIINIMNKAENNLYLILEYMFLIKFMLI